MFLAVNLLKNLFLSHMAKVTEAPLDRLAAEAVKAHEKLRALGEPKTPMDTVRFIDLKAKADAADEAWLRASERAERWADKQATPTRFVSSYLSGKLDAATAAVVVYPYVPQVTDWFKGLIG